MVNLPAVTLCAILLTFSQSAAADPEATVRTSHPRLIHALNEGLRGSGTFRDLVHRLQASDVIIHAEPAPASYAVDGGLQFVGATPSRRYLRITIRTDLPMTELVGLLGHELMHAVEVADHAGVRDEALFRRLYEGIGRSTLRGGAVTYDTDAAVAVGYKVALELAGATGSRAAIGK